MTAGSSWSHARAVWTMVLATFLWGTAGVVTRQVEQAQGFEVTFWRSAFTVLALLVILPLWRGRGVWARIAWRQPELWLSGLCWAVMFTAFMVALTLTGVPRVLVTMAFGPFLTALLARGVTGQRLPRRTWLAIAVAGAGMTWMFAGQLGESRDGAAWLGSIIALGVPMAAAVNWTVSQHGQSHGTPVDLVPAVLLGAVLSALAVAPWAWPTAASARDLGWLAALGVGQLAIPCVLAMLSARVLPAAEVSLLGLLEIVFGIGLVWAIVGEAPRPEVLQGGALVMGALLANELMGWWRQRRTVRGVAAASGLGRL
ncbi:MAG: DMT family transporter [Burkholderiaceae bacterium]